MEEIEKMFNPLTIREISILLNAKVICGEDLLGKEVNHVFASDLMSDVLTLQTDDILLVTGLANIQTIRTAEMSEVKAILFARGKKASPEMIELAEENDMVLMECSFSLYRISGLLWEVGMAPVY